MAPSLMTYRLELVLMLLPRVIACCHLADDVHAIAIVIVCREVDRKAMRNACVYRHDRDDLIDVVDCDIALVRDPARNVDVRVSAIVTVFVTVGVTKLEESENVSVMNGVDQNETSENVNMKEASESDYASANENVGAKSERHDHGHDVGLDRVRAHVHHP